MVNKIEKHISVNNILLSIISGILLSLGWTQMGIGWITFFAFIPLLVIFDNLQNSIKKSKGATILGLSYITFFTWNCISTYWVSYASVPGAIVAIMLSALFMAGVIYFSFYCYIILGKRIGNIAFVTNWVAFEYLFMNSQISWPWLILGNSLANNTTLIQWYEYTGHLGGSIWVLSINILLFEIYTRFINQNKKRLKTACISLVLLVFIPIIFSIITFFNYNENGKEVDIVVIQPNIDPYNEKFNGITEDEQLDLILKLCDSTGDSEVDYFVSPETALAYGIWEDDIQNAYSIDEIRSFLQKFPDTKFIIGATTLKMYRNACEKSETAQQYANTDHYYDHFNTSLQIDTSRNIHIYHKSRLVPGVEKLPYPKIFGFMQDLMSDLDCGNYGTQKNRTVFPNEKLNINAGVPICYESVYGEFISEFVNEGANILFVITNDGWWHDTPGYKQHRSYSKIRAIETRKSIARSANTGISCFINQRGEIIKELGWWQRGAIRNTLKANSNITFYTKHGDYLARMALGFSVIFVLLIFAAYIQLRKNLSKS